MVFIVYMWVVYVCMGVSNMLIEFSMFLIIVNLFLVFRLDVYYVGLWFFYFRIWGSVIFVVIYLLLVIFFRFV